MQLRLTAAVFECEPRQKTVRTADFGRFCFFGVVLWARFFWVLDYLLH
nr:MAG TPA: hypothetical protein [Caudoviricetes sp.]